MIRRAIPRMLRTAAAEAVGTAVTGIPGAGSVMGLAAELAAGGVLEAAEGRERGPTIGGVKVPHRALRAYDGSIRVYSLTAETYDRHESDLKELARQGLQAVQCDGGDVTIHRIRTRQSWGRWFYLHAGSTEPQDRPGRLVSSIPGNAMREQAMDAYMSAWMGREPHYSYVARDGLAYRRLVVPAYDKAGRVDELLVLIKREPRKLVRSPFQRRQRQPELHSGSADVVVGSNGYLALDSWVVLDPLAQTDRKGDGI